MATISQFEARAEIDALRASDRVAWSVTQEHIRRAAARFRRALAEDWEDAVQEAQIKVLRALREKSIPNQRAFRGLIGRITYTTCIDQVRRRKIRETIPLDTLQEPLARASMHPSAALERAEAQGQSALVLRQLSGECRQLLWMLYQGRSYAEIADLLGASPGAIRARAHRCRQRARVRYLRITSPVLEIALRLFRQQGFHQTRIKQIAGEAGLTPEQVSEAFGDKPSILWAAVTRMITGSAGVSLEDSDPFQAICAEPDPHRRVRLAVQMTSERFRKGIRDIHAIVYSAARSDADCRFLLRQMQCQRLGVSRRLVRTVIGGLQFEDRINVDALAVAAMEIDSSMTYRQLRDDDGCNHSEAVQCIEERLRHKLLH